MSRLQTALIFGTMLSVMLVTGWLARNWPLSPPAVAPNRDLVRWNLLVERLACPEAKAVEGDRLGPLAEQLERCIKPVPAPPPTVAGVLTTVSTEAARVLARCDDVPELLRRVKTLERDLAGLRRIFLGPHGVAVP